MTKDKIISNTFIFIGIMIFINIFQRMFGSENTLVGVAIITASLALLERDLTVEPIKNLIKLLGLNLILGFFAFWSNNNIWLGLVLNFIALFMIAYLLSYKLRKSIVVPFGLQYLFMLFAPVYGESFKNRILSLIFGAFLIMALQFLANKDKLSKVGGKKVDKIYQELLVKISILKLGVTGEGGKLGIVDSNILEDINNIKRIVYDKRINNFYITNHGKITTNIIWTLERINILLNTIQLERDKNAYISFLGDMYNIISKLKDGTIKLEEIKALENKYKNSDLKQIYVHEFVTLMGELIEDLLEIFNLKKKNRNTINTSISIPNKFKKLTIHKRDFSFDSVKLTYAIKLAIAGSLTAFLTGYFNLSEGRWMCYTIFSLIQPYSETCRSKASQRIQGTLIGALIIFISFSLIENQTARMFIILLAGYLNPFATNYRNSIICVTVSAIAGCAIIDGTTKFVLSRIIYVLIGTIISLIINKYILPYKIEDGKKYLLKTYGDVINHMFNSMGDKDADESIKNLFLIPSLIEEKLKVTNFGAQSVEEKEFIYNQRRLINNIYHYHTLIKENKDIREKVGDVVDKVKDLTQKDNFDYDYVISKVNEKISNTKDEKEVVLLENIISIIENYKRIQKFVAI
ncbi:FUSC family protein [Clostridium chauvoei]|uniref:Integral membrane bound transporter domain-containing protein n=1 Tax=Clostridium chauvoei JF4335 TaxID=1351755 RepID=A0A1U6JK18_9CLOT|nr:FUSC family protein [Clostridium chauvoei]MBX7283439.1 FUSC family protein [Clostridium chauvoei]MBX7285984.1 FUSC family protein [Clostridium chauvoei]MBX7288443.1 FUSC family protein [Clostridium chauvoei]MBX7293532.1 FUSC family protein [Clostridium chauvoei]MBX7296078.1 FUSC family protein [Clostridium chauvoei]